MNLKNYIIVINNEKQEESFNKKTLLEIQNKNADTQIVDIDIIKTEPIKQDKEDEKEIDIKDKKYDTIKCKNDHQLVVQIGALE